MCCTFVVLLLSLCCAVSVIAFADVCSSMYDDLGVALVRSVGKVTTRPADAHKTVP